MAKSVGEVGGDGHLWQFDGEYILEGKFPADSNEADLKRFSLNLTDINDGELWFCLKNRPKGMQISLEVELKIRDDDEDEKVRLINRWKVTNLSEESPHVTLTRSPLPTAEFIKGYRWTAEVSISHVSRSAESGKPPYSCLIPPVVTTRTRVGSRSVNASVRIIPKRTNDPQTVAAPTDVFEPESAEDEENSNNDCDSDSEEVHSTSDDEYRRFVAETTSTSPVSRSTGKSANRVKTESSTLSPSSTSSSSQADVADTTHLRETIFRLTSTLNETQRQLAKNEAEAEAKLTEKTTELVRLRLDNDRLLSLYKSVKDTFAADFRIKWAAYSKAKSEETDKLTGDLKLKSESIDQLTADLALKSEQLQKKEETHQAELDKCKREVIILQQLIDQQLEEIVRWTTVVGDKVKVEENLTSEIHRQSALIEVKSSVEEHLRGQLNKANEEIERLTAAVAQLRIDNDQLINAKPIQTALVPNSPQKGSNLAATADLIDTEEQVEVRPYALWAPPPLADFYLQSVDKYEFCVDRVKLADKSDYFMALFTNDMKEKRDGRVKENYIGDVLYEVIKFVYEGKPTGNFFNVIEQVYDAAEMFNFAGLKTICEKKLVEQVSFDSVCDSIRMATLYGGKELLGKSLKFVWDHIEDPQISFAQLEKLFNGDGILLKEFAQVAVEKMSPKRKRK